MRDSREEIYRDWNEAADLIWIAEGYLEEWEEAGVLNGNGGRGWRLEVGIGVVDSLGSGIQVDIRGLFRWLRIVPFRRICISVEGLPITNPSPPPLSVAYMRRRVKSTLPTEKHRTCHTHTYPRINIHLLRVRFPAARVSCIRVPPVSRDRCKYVAVQDGCICRYRVAGAGCGLSNYLHACILRPGTCFCAFMLCM